jgi:hypothetical protein
VRGERERRERRRDLIKDTYSMSHASIALYMAS